MSRVILHSDVDGFYAAVECLYKPQIRSSPVAVCGDKELRHGIVLAKNQIAKYKGIKTGETIGDAKEKCPALITVPPRMDMYYKFSGWAREIYEEYADNIEAFGLDEEWIEITNLVRDEYDGRLVANEIRRKMKEQLGITCSIGISFNKVFSKLATDLRKGDASTIITRENYKDIVWKLPADNLLGVNRGTKKILNAIGMTTIGDIAKTPVELLVDIFGKIGLYLHKYANGDENSAVKHKSYVEPPKTVGRIETTYRDMKTIDDVRRVVYALSDSVASLLRQQNYMCQTVKIYIRDFELKSCDRQGKLNSPSFFANDIATKAMDIFHRQYHFTKPLRSIGVRACDLVSDDAAFQSSLFYDIEQYDRTETLEKTINDLRLMFGYDIIKRGVVMEDSKLTYIPPDYNRSTYRVGSPFNHA